MDGMGWDGMPRSERAVAFVPQGTRHTELMLPRHWCSGAGRHSPRKSGSGSWCHCPVFEAWLASSLFAPLPLCSLLSRSAVALRGRWKCMRVVVQSRHSVQNDDRRAPKFQSYVPPTHTLTLLTSTSFCFTQGPRATPGSRPRGVVVLDRKTNEQQYLPEDLVCLCVLSILYNSSPDRLSGFCIRFLPPTCPPSHPVGMHRLPGV